MTEPRTALVAGGGIAGAATALALQKAGLEPVVFEARPASDGAGAFLTLGSNGLEALRQLGADGFALAAGFPTPSMTLRNGTGKRLGDVPASTARPGGAVSRTLMRAELAGLLLAEAERRGIRVERGRRLVGAEPAGDGVLARFADGSEAAGDLLIGADGIHSAVRRAIDPGAPAPRYGGLLNTGGRARGVRAADEPGRYELIFGRRAFFGHVTAPDGEVWWFANLPWPAEPSSDDLCALHREDLRGRLLHLFAGDAGPATALIEAGGEPMPVSPIHSVPHLPHWHRGRMLVVGDAAHAPSPSSGQGASLAIEDAVVLATCLRDGAGIEAAFARFEQIRRPRVEKIIRWAERVNSSKAAGPVGRRIRDAVLPLALRIGAHSSAHEQTYGHRVEWPAT
ncbi:MAG TPA: FAD-dependent monooxygenase [Solirubrobacteraceae bacterium]|nr:FAD-dependent monooxygenase [Solirubrobacteraceae bacterium]